MGIPRMRPNGIVCRFILYLLDLLTSQSHKADSAGTPPKPCNADLVDMEWATQDLTKSELQQGLGNWGIRIQKVPATRLFQCPLQVCDADFVCNVKVKSPERSSLAICRTPIRNSL
jgi:hypothetical protein